MADNPDEQHVDRTEELVELINIMAHELRHPATVFRGYASLLLDDDYDLSADSLYDALNAIDQAAIRLTRIVNNITDIASIENGRLKLFYSEVMARTLIMRALREMKSLGVPNEFVTRPCDENLVVEVDKERIKEVLKILLENAVECSPEDSPIETWYVRKGGEAVFSVADRGTGISRENREAIFERFKRVEHKKHPSQAGVGLGLFIAKTIVESHQGWIRADPREGGGSVFSFGVPLSPSG